MVDFQHREGSRTGSGGQLSEAQANIERRERLRKLALETIGTAMYIMNTFLLTLITPHINNNVNHKQI